MSGRVVAGLVFFSMSAWPAIAQNSPGRATPDFPSPPGSEAATERMEDPQAGDHWTYETRDEITGVVKETTTQVITEVSPTSIGLRIGAVGNSNFAFSTYDRGWNLIDAPGVKYTPNDGSGVRLPLEVGKKWMFQSTDFSSGRNVTFKRTGMATVTGRESITTRAGTFDAFKLETAATLPNASDPTKKYEFAWQTWYVPAIDHWVKRVSSSRWDGQLRSNNSQELVEFGRR